MLAKLIVSFFGLNAPLFGLLFLATVYLMLAVRLKRMLNSSIRQPRMPLIDANLLEKLLRSQLIEKSNIILNSVLIGFHLLLLMLVSLLFVSNLGSHGSSFLSLTGNVSVLNFGFSGNYQALINSKKQADELKSYCKANRLSSICEFNDQINQQISKKLKNLRMQQQLGEKDLKDATCPRGSPNLNDESNEPNRWAKTANDLSEIEQCKSVYSKGQDKLSDQKADHKTDLFNNFYLAELDKLLSGQIGAAFLGIIAIFLSLTHYADTLLGSFLELKINKLIWNLDLTYRELNYTHIAERVLTPFAIYFDFKHPTNATNLGWFTISWSLLNIINRFGYLRRLSNEKRFRTSLDDLLKTKLLFYGSLLLLFSYQMSLNNSPSAGLLQNTPKIFNLFYGLLLFLLSLSDYEKVQENRPINLDLNNNQIASSNNRPQSNSTSFNRYNYASHSANALLQPVCNLSGRY